MPAVLEMLGIPYSGSDPLTLAATLDKDVARRLVRLRGVAGPQGTLDPARRRPRGHGAGDSRRRVLRRRAITRVILKPAFEGSSKGIRGRCLADDADRGRRRALRAGRRDYGQPILVEEFIDGDEVTVGLVGNGAGARSSASCGSCRSGPTARFVYSLEVKRDWARRVDYEAPARLPPR